MTMVGNLGKKFTIKTINDFLKTSPRRSYEVRIKMNTCQCIFRPSESTVTRTVVDEFSWNFREGQILGAEIIGFDFMFLRLTCVRVNDNDDDELDFGNWKWSGGPVYPISKRPMWNSALYARCQQYDPDGNSQCCTSITVLNISRRKLSKMYNMGR